MSGDGEFYSVRISGKLWHDLTAASEKYGCSMSEIFCMAVRKARRLGNVVVSENNNDDHIKESLEYPSPKEPLHVYGFKQLQGESADWHRECLKVYLSGYDLTPTRTTSAGEQYVRQCVQTAAALMRDIGKPPTRAMINKYRPKKKKTVKSV